MSFIHFFYNKAFFNKKSVIAKNTEFRVKIKELYQNTAHGPDIHRLGSEHMTLNSARNHILFYFFESYVLLLQTCVVAYPVFFFCSFDVNYKFRRLKCYIVAHALINNTTFTTRLGGRNSFGPKRVCESECVFVCVGVRMFSFTKQIDPSRAQRKMVSGDPIFYICLFILSVHFFYFFYLLLWLILFFFFSSGH